MASLKDLARKARGYFDPESNQGNNFWNSSNPLIRGLVNTSVGVQNAPRRVTNKFWRGRGGQAAASFATSFPGKASVALKRTFVDQPVTGGKKFGDWAVDNALETNPLKLTKSAFKLGWPQEFAKSAGSVAAVGTPGGAKTLGGLTLFDAVFPGGGTGWVPHEFGKDIVSSVRSGKPTFKRTEKSLAGVATRIPENMPRAGFYGTLSNPLGDRAATAIMAGKNLGPGTQRAVRAGITGAVNVAEDYTTWKAGLTEKPTWRSNLFGFLVPALLDSVTGKDIADTAKNIDKLMNMPTDHLGKMDPNEFIKIDVPEANPVYIKPLGIRKITIDLLTNGRTPELEKRLAVPGIGDLVSKDMEWLASQSGAITPGAKIGGKETDLTSEAKKYKNTVNLQNKDDVDYLKRIFSDSVVEDIKNGKTANWRGESYEDVAKVNIISKPYEQPKLDIKPYSGTRSFYHGTSPQSADLISKQGFVAGSDLPEDAFRSGGYGQLQGSISLSSDPRSASVFTGSGSEGSLIKTDIDPKAKIVSIKGIDYAEDLNDHVSQLRKDGVDAVWIGGGEKELVVINPKIIKVGEIRKFTVYDKDKQLTDIYNQAKVTDPSVYEAKIRRIYKANEEKVREAIGLVWMEMDASEAGQRIFLEHDATSPDPQVIGIKSTFPSWIPEDLRSRKLFDIVLKNFGDIETLKYPTGRRIRQRALYDAVLDAVDDIAGVDTSEARSAILKSYDQEIKEAVEAPKAIRERFARSERAPGEKEGLATIRNTDDPQVAQTEPISTKPLLQKSKTVASESLEDIIQKSPTPLKSKVNVIDYLRTPSNVLNVTLSAFKKPELTPQDKKFNTTFAKFIADKDVSKTTGTQRAVPLTKIRSEIAQNVIDFREGVITKATPEVKEAAELVKKEFDQAYKDAVDAGVDVGYLKNYVPHYWKESKEVIEQAYKSAGKSFKQAKQRVLPTYKEGVSLGLTPKYTHPAQMLEAYITGLEQYRASKNFLEGLKSNKIIVHTKAGRKLPGYSPISAPGLGKSQYTFPTLEGKTTVIGDWWAKDTDARKISQIFGFLNEGTLAKTLEKTANISSKLQDIVLSGGVPGTPINAFSIAQAQKELLGGRVRSPLATTIDALVPGKTQKFFVKNADQIKKMQSRNVQLRSNFSVDNMIDTPLRKKIFGDGISGAWTKLVNEPTFGKFMPMLQIRLFNDIEAQALKSGVGERGAADVAAKAVSNFYGLVNTAKEAARDKALRDATTTFLFAPQYRESMVNLWVNEVKALKNPLALENRTNIKFAIGSVVTYMAMNQINRAVNGHNMSENPEGKKDKLLIPVGDRTIGIPFLSSIATMPRGVARIAGEVGRADVSGAAKEAFTTFASIGLKPLGEIALNQGHFGNEIVEEGDSSKEKVTKQLTHIFGAINHPYARAIMEVYTKPDQPIYQRLSIAMELPFRFYKTESVENAPFWEKYHKLKSVQEQYDAMKKKGSVKAEQFLEEYSDEINEFNIMRGYMDQYYKETEGGGKSDILKNFEFYQKGINPNLLPGDREFEQSKDAPQGMLDKLGLYGTSFIRNPQATIDAAVAGQPLRKMRGGASVVERQTGISGIDVGKKSTQVDHHIPLWAGGQDRTDNYESLKAGDHKAKSAYEAGLRAKLEKGEMSQRQVKKAIEEWYTSNNIKLVSLTPSERATPGIVSLTDKADIKVARDAFDDSGKNFEEFGDVVFRRTEAGNVTTTPKLAYDYQLNTAKMSKLKKSKDMKSWMSLAEKQIDIIEKQLKDDSLDELEKIKLQNRAETLIGQMEKYSGYGGFTKGGKGKKKGVKVSFKKITPAKIKTKKTTRKSPPKVRIKKLPSIKVTKTKAPSLNFKTKAYKSAKIGGFRNDLV